MTQTAPSSKANTTATAPPKRKSVFVVSPIGAPGSDAHRNASYALKYIFREALQEDGWDVHRADEGESPDSIGQHVIRKLWEADLVIADLTGHNPNVFYELAIAHGWRKPVVHLIAKGETIPFDIVDQRTIFYDITDLASVEKTVLLLRKYADYAIGHVDELITPLTSFEKFSHIRHDNTDGGTAVAEILEEVVSRLSRLEHRIVRADAPREGSKDRHASEDAEGIVDLLVAINELGSRQGLAPVERKMLNQMKARANDLLKEQSADLRSTIIEVARMRSGD